MSICSGFKVLMGPPTLESPRDMPQSGPGQGSYCLGRSPAFPARPALWFHDNPGLRRGYLARGGFAAVAVQQLAVGVLRLAVQLLLELELPGCVFLDFLQRLALGLG